MTENDATPLNLQIAAPARLGGWSLLVGVCVLCVMGVTIRDYGLTTDEPRYIENSQRILQWLADFRTVGLTENLSAERLQTGWFFARPDSKNLPLVSVVSTTGYLLGGRLDTRPAAYRWGNVLVFAVTCGVVFHWMSTTFSIMTGMVTVACLIGIPRLFANANLCSIDPLVGCCWVLASWALVNSRERWGWAMLFGVLVGLGMTAKPTFWFAIPVWIVWGLSCRPRELWRSAVCLATVTPLVFYLGTPMWWGSPVDGFVDYLNMLRSDGAGWKIDAYYLGEIYQADGFPPLPWHAILVLTLITTPLGVMALSAIGVLSWRRTHDPQQRELLRLWIYCGATLPLICMLPGTPAHDGVRLYLPAFFFVALLAGVGFERWCRHLCSYWPRRSVAWAITLGSCVALIGISLKIHPTGLSYYNMLIGGYSGATRVRPLSNSLPVVNRPLFERTYWWDMLTPSALADLQTVLPPDAKVWILPEHYGVEMLQSWGQLRDDIQPATPDVAQFVLLDGRMGRLNDPRVAPLGTMFLHGEAVWERRFAGERVIGLFRWKSR